MNDIVNNLLDTIDMNHYRTGFMAPRPKLPSDLAELTGMALRYRKEARTVEDRIRQVEQSHYITKANYSAIHDRAVTCARLRTDAASWHRKAAEVERRIEQLTNPVTTYWGFAA